MGYATIGGLAGIVYKSEINSRSSITFSLMKKIDKVNYQEMKKSLNQISYKKIFFIGALTGAVMRQGFFSIQDLFKWCSAKKK